MIALIQRVSRAEVRVGAESVGAIGPGLLVLAAVQRGDGEAQARRMAERLAAYRVFPDADGRMNLDVTQAGGGILLVPQFTLAADTRKGNRPSLGRAADPAVGQALFETLVAEVRARCSKVATGRFGADMDVELVNRGPVTFWLEVPPDQPA
ncbi:MAG: D-tyrosyl-tRNA(Tyr) deacylase [Chromatiales bacterium]|nr:MAG: D-tyrosyl-tRNA(Tyr) deacylase [Chromatiales bacterium]